MGFFDANFWIAISFIIFLYFAYRPIRNAILMSLDSKIKDIKDKLAQTEKLKHNAEKLLADARQAIKQLDQHKQEILQKSKESTNELIKAKAKEMELMLARKKDSAIKSIDNQKTKAVSQLQEEFSANVIQMVRKYLVQTKNNSVSDEEIINNFLGKK